jgi:hypothetical protein
MANSFRAGWCVSDWVRQIQDTLRAAGAEPLPQQRRGGHQRWKLAGRRIAIPTHRVSSARQELNVRAKVRRFLVGEGA